MANAPSFVEHALDLLSSLGPVAARRMFGGHGLYARGVMFALLDDDELFLKTDEESRPRFREAGCRMWVYRDPGMEETSYWRPPDEAHEDPEAMRPWALLGLEAALRKKAAKEASERAKAERRKERQRKAAGGVKGRPKRRGRRARGRRSGRARFPPFRRTVSTGPPARRGNPRGGLPGPLEVCHRR